jgi:excinuclease ABC subunit A
LGKLDKPDVDDIEGLSPAIPSTKRAHSSIPVPTSRLSRKNDYLRVHFCARGKPHCPICVQEIRKIAWMEKVVCVLSLRKKLKGKSPFTRLVKGRKGEYTSFLYDFLRTAS